MDDITAKQLPRVILRALEPEDVAPLYEWENLDESFLTGDKAAPYSLQQLTDYVLNYDADIFSARQLRLMITDAETRESVGCVDLYDFDPVNSRAGVGIIIAPGLRKHGYGASALASLASYCRDVLSIHQLYAIVGADNHPSRTLFESCGYKISGRLRSWLRRAGKYSDAYFYQLLLV